MITALIFLLVAFKNVQSQCRWEVASNLTLDLRPLQFSQYTYIFLASCKYIVKIHILCTTNDDIDHETIKTSQESELSQDTIYSEISKVDVDEIIANEFMHHLVQQDYVTDAIGDDITDEKDVYYDCNN